MSEFMGGPCILAQSEIEKAISKVSSRTPEEIHAVIAALATNSFFEIEVPLRGFTAAADQNDYERLHRAARNAAEWSGAPLRFRIHRAFRNTLLIDSA
jgi:hypothetical protein